MVRGAPSSHDVVDQYDGECLLSAGLTAFVAAAMIGAGIADQREQIAMKAQQAAIVMCTADLDQTPNYPTPLAQDEQCLADKS